jgi:hypothetical protein
LFTRSEEKEKGKKTSMDMFLTQDQLDSLRSNPSMALEAQLLQSCIHCSEQFTITVVCLGSRMDQAFDTSQPASGTENLITRILGGIETLFSGISTAHKSRVRLYKTQIEALLAHQTILVYGKCPRCQKEFMVSVQRQ